MPHLVMVVSITLRLYVYYAACHKLPLQMSITAVTLTEVKQIWLMYVLCICVCRILMDESMLMIKYSKPKDDSLCLFQKLQM